MPVSSSDPDARQRARSDEEGVSEVIGFLLTFAIISFILLVSMLAFNDAQQRAENRLIEIQGASAAQRVAAAAVDLALFVSDHPYETSVAIDLPTELQGIGYKVHLCSDLPDPQTNTCSDLDHNGDDYCEKNACPYVKTSSFRGDAQFQSTFLLAGETFCSTQNSAGGGTVHLVYFPTLDCIGLQDATNET